MTRVADTCPRYKAKSIQRIDDNVFLVIATLKNGKMIKRSKNMVILRHNKRELTLINPVRLEEDGEASILRLGRIQRLIRLAPRQGIEHDKYYLQRFPNARRWAPGLLAAASSDENNEDADDQSNQSRDSQQQQQQLQAQQQQQQHASPPIHRLLTDEDDAILPACHVFCFQSTAQPECALIILQDYVGNLLVTAEAVQAHRDNPVPSIAARFQLAVKGMMTRDVVIPPAWIKNMQCCDAKGKGKAGLRHDLEALLRLDFERLVGATGTMIHERAKEKVVLAVEQTLPLW